MTATLAGEPESVALGEPTKLREAKPRGIRACASKQFFALGHGRAIVRGRVTPGATQKWYHIRYHRQVTTGDQLLAGVRSTSGPGEPEGSLLVLHLVSGNHPRHPHPSCSLPPASSLAQRSSASREVEQIFT